MVWLKLCDHCYEKHVAPKASYSVKTITLTLALNFVLGMVARCPDVVLAEVCGVLAQIQ